MCPRTPHPVEDLTVEQRSWWQGTRAQFDWKVPEEGRARADWGVAP